MELGRGSWNGHIRKLYCTHTRLDKITMDWTRQIRLHKTDKTTLDRTGLVTLDGTGLQNTLGAEIELF